jgi:hypothetical protein
MTAVLRLLAHRRLIRGARGAMDALKKDRKVRAIIIAFKFVSGVWDGV